MIRNISDFVPLEVSINGVRIVAFKTFTIENTFTTFSDALQMEIANLKGVSGIRHYSNQVRLGHIIQVKWESDILFQGKIETLRSSATRDEHTLRIEARDSTAEATETMATPKSKKTVTDNDIIQQVLGSGFTYQLEAGVVQKDFEISGKETNGQVAERVAKLGGFMLWNEGTTIYKQKPAATGNPVMILNSAENHFESYELNQSIQNAKSKLVGFSSTKKYDKKEISKTVSLEIKLRKETYTPALTREARVQLDQGDEDDLDNKLSQQMDASLPTEQLSFRIGGIVRLNLNSLVTIKIPEENIDQNMVVISRKWVLEQNGLRHTDITCILPGRKIWRD